MIEKDMKKKKRKNDKKDIWNVEIYRNIVVK